MDKNIYELIRGRGVHLADGLVRAYMWQLLRALDHMHRSGIFHRWAQPVGLWCWDNHGRAYRARHDC